LLLLAIYVVINRKNLHLKMLFTALMILINIPSVWIILPLQKDIEDKAFLKITNHTGLDNIEVSIENNSKIVGREILDDGDSEVFNYETPYLIYESDRYNENDTSSLIIRRDQIIDTIKFKALRKDECRRFIINKGLVINEL
jgi:hypothetical protein